MIEIAPESDLAEQSLLRSAQINFTRKSHEAGREFITTLLTKYPDSIYGDRAMLDLGNSFTAEGKKDLAIQTFTDLLAKFPRSILLNEAREKIRKLRGDV
ncbi:MAG: tetratricopeptide repeat protein [Ignavibacteria bacterium]|nr:tetratricopeptide repeat protein [Ignavibacteria bacterium]